MIEIKNLNYIYEDGTKALNNVNIDFNKGNKIAIIGSNGAGKSTFFLNLMGILKPKSGEIYFKGEKVKYNKKYLYEYRKKVGIVFQDPDKQIFYSNVFDDVAFGLRNLDVLEEQVKEIVEKSLRKTGAYEFKDKPVHFLSMGQKKRVAIAGALAMNNELILFDEPTAGLDPVMTEGVIKVINELSDDGKKIVISSHNMDLIYNLCDYGYVLNKGEIIGEGKIEDIFVQEELLQKAGLNEPWLVKLHKNIGVPLFKKEDELYAHFNKNKA